MPCITVCFSTEIFYVLSLQVCNIYWLFEYLCLKREKADLVHSSTKINRFGVPPPEPRSCKRGGAETARGCVGAGNWRFLPTQNLVHVHVHVHVSTLYEPQVLSRTCRLLHLSGVSASRHPFPLTVADYLPVADCGEVSGYPARYTWGARILFYGSRVRRFSVRVLGSVAESRGP